jgi:GDP-L-fucose synthase
LKSKKILITGASGVMGHALVSELEKNGYKNVVAINSTQADLTDSKKSLQIFKDIKPAIVFHLAARVYGIMGNLANQAQAYLENILINTHVIEAAHQVGVQKIIAMGSSAIYSDNVSLPMRESEIWHGAPHPSEAAYAHTKRSMLAQLEAYKNQYGMEFAFCISTNLYGPYDKFDEKWGHVIPSLISKFYRGAQTGEQISVWGTGQAKRDFLFSADAAYAMRLIAEQYNGPINLATGDSYTIKDTVEMIKHISGYQPTVQWDTNKPNGQNLRHYDISALKDLGFKPNYSLEQGLTDTYQWFAKNVEQDRR